MLKKEVLRGKKEFANVYSKGKSVGERYIVLFFKQNGLSYNRTGILASKKVGNSVTRNRARRMVRESYRNVKEDISIGYDMVFVSRKTIIDRKQQEVEKSVMRALEKAKLIDRGSRI